MGRNRNINRNVLTCKKVYDVKTDTWKLVAIDTNGVVGLSYKDRKTFKNYPPFLMKSIMDLLDE
jgi:hypothetical protein